MRIQRLALVVLFFFVTGLVSATAGEVLRSSADNFQASHTEGSPCPDPDDAGHPCGPACACTCCPGHAAAPAFVAQRFAFGIPPSSELKVHPNDDLHPKDVHFRIFHPPRA